MNPNDPLQQLQQGPTFEMVDTDGDGRQETGVRDTNADGVDDQLIHDGDGDGYFEMVGIDRNFDGKHDLALVDTDSDGGVDYIEDTLSPGGPQSPVQVGYDDSAGYGDAGGDCGCE